MAKSGLSNSLIGKWIVPLRNSEHLIGNPNGPWPVNDPNLSGEHLACIQAAWTEGGSVKVLACTPGGTVFEVHMQNVRLQGGV